MREEEVIGGRVSEGPGSGCRQGSPRRANNL